jgi:hypothetical protein
MVRKAFVFLGIFAAMLVVIVVVWYIRFLRESRPAVSVAIARAKLSPEVVNAVGNSSIHTDRVTGRVIGAGDDSGNADLAIKISGIRGEGSLLEWAQNGCQGWHICSLSFVDKAGKEIVIVSDADTSCERE